MEYSLPRSIKIHQVIAESLEASRGKAYQYSHVLIATQFMKIQEKSPQSLHFHQFEFHDCKAVRKSSTPP
jgi:hypothetical protein